MADGDVLNTGRATCPECGCEAGVFFAGGGWLFGPHRTHNGHFGGECAGSWRECRVPVHTEPRSKVNT